MKKHKATELKLDPASARKLIQTNVSNLAAKVRSGRTLNKYEVELLLQEAERPSTGKSPGHPLPPYVGSKVALAAALKISPQLVDYHAKQSSAPKPTPNGRLDVSAWRGYLAERGKLPQLVDADYPEAATQTQARAEQLLIQNDRLRLKLKREKEQLIPKLVAQQVFGRLLTSAKSRCYTSIIRFVTLARMAENTTAAMAAVKTEMDGIWQSLTDPSKWMKK